MTVRLWISLLLAVAILVVCIVKIKDYDWMSDNSSYLTWAQLISIWVMDISEEFFIVNWIIILLLFIALVIQLYSGHMYRKVNNLINYEKRNKRRKKAILIMKILIPILIFIKILYEIEVYFHWI